MKKLSLLSLTLLIASISFGAYHQLGVAIYLNTTEQIRYKSAEQSAGTGNIYETFLLSADAYTAYQYPDPVSYGDQSASIKAYFPVIQDSCLVAQKENHTGFQYYDPITKKNVYSYNVNGAIGYTGWVGYWKAKANLGTPLGYAASANAYIMWND